ncbi:MAG TPA: hypothetical protein VI112_02870 [Bacteroidia bacterium]|jgi:hypothetical protein
MQLPEGASFQFLGDQEKKTLAAHQQTGFTGCLIAFAILLLVGGCFALAVVNGGGGVFVAFMLFLAGGLSLYSTISSSNALKQDMQEGKKVVLRTSLTNKTERHGKRTAYYTLHAGGKQFGTDISTYVKSEIGQIIEIHYAPYSMTTLKIILEPGK